MARIGSSNVPPGSYKVTAALTGFQSSIRDGVVVAVGQNVALPLTLGVAAVQESVLVTGASPIVDATAHGHRDQLHAGRAEQGAELTRPVGAPAHGARRDR